MALKIPKIKSILWSEGTGEKTGLDDSSVHAVFWFFIQCCKSADGLEVSKF